MNSKERVQAAIARRKVDRVPLGLYAIDCDTAAQVLGRPTFIRNKIETTIALWEGRRDEVAEGLKKDSVELFRKLDCIDLIIPKEAQLLPPKGYEPERPKKIGADEWQDRKGRIFRASRGANEIQCVYSPPSETKAYALADFEKPVEVAPPDPSVFEVIDHLYAALGAERYIASFSGGTTAMTLLGGTEKGLMMYVLEPEVVLAANRQSVARQNALDRYHIRPGAPGVMMEQDMAGTNGPLVSPKMFREMCLPFLRERIARVKQLVPQVIFHNCGNNIPIMDAMIEAGVDCYQSLQTTAGMEVGKLKRLFGDRLCFWGGVAVEVLIMGTPEDVRREVRQALEAGAPGGGFILGPSHSVAFNTKYDNFMAMLDEYVKLRDKY